MASPLPCPEQTLHQIILGRDLPVIRAAVFFHDLEDLVPEPHRLVHVINADVDERGRDRLLGGRVSPYDIEGGNTGGGGEEERPGEL